MSAGRGFPPELPRATAPALQVCRNTARSSTRRRPPQCHAFGCPGACAHADMYVWQPLRWPAIYLSKNKSFLIYVEFPPPGFVVTALPEAPACTQACGGSECFVAVWSVDLEMWSNEAPRIVPGVRVAHVPWPPAPRRSAPAPLPPQTSRPGKQLCPCVT